MQSIDFEYMAASKFPFDCELVAAFFADVDNLIRCTSDLESCVRVGDSSYAWTLVEKRELGLVLHPKYVLDYVWEGGHRLRWSTAGHEADSNLRISACVDFIPNGSDACVVRVRESIAFDLPVSFITAKIVKAIACREAEADMVGMLERLSMSLERSLQGA